MAYPVKSQYNLVPNYSFESYTQCPSFANKNPPPPWYLPTNIIESYVNSCANGCFGVPKNCAGSGKNYQYAKTGNAYSIVGFYFTENNNFNRSYIQIKLIDSLKRNKYYFSGYYINLTTGTQIACNNASLLLTKTPEYVDTVTTPFGVLNQNPQITNYSNPIIKDTLNWIKVSGVYKAQGSEQYITIGNFKTNSQTKLDTLQTIIYKSIVYNIDDVFVIPLDSMPLKADAGKDTTITIGDSVFIGSLTNGIDSLKWQIQNTGTAIDSTRPGFWVHPLVNTCYVLTQTVNGFTSSDTVCVNVLPLPLKMLSFTALYQPPLTPPKEGNVLLQWQTANEINVSHFNILKSIDGVNFKAIGKMKANNKSYNEYSFIDGGLAPSPLGEGWGEVYYKIAAIDFDGKMSFSEVKKVVIADKQITKTTIYPNPNNGSFKIIFENTDIKQVKVFDIYGKVLFEKKYSTNDTEATLNLKVARGLYFVHTQNSNNGKNTIEKVVIQ